MTELKVAWAQVTLATGVIHEQTKAPYTLTFNRGDLVNSERFDSKVWADKIERLFTAGALVELDAPEAPVTGYKSPFDIPLTGGGGDELTSVVVDEANDNVGEDEDEDGEDPTPVPTPDDVQVVRPNANVGTEVWRAYAERVGVQVSSEAGRTEIIAACEAQGK